MTIDLWYESEERSVVGELMRSFPRTLHRALGLAGIVVVLLLAAESTVLAQEPEDELGNWLIYNGTVRFSDRWSVFTETQLRLWEVASNVNEWFIRAAGHYNLSPKALVGIGYMRSEVSPFESGSNTSEDRLYEQFTIGHEWGRTRLEHRYRLEQRWIEEAGETRYSNRLRYRLQVTTPIGREAIEPGTYFVNVYDEIFLNFDSTRAFDQNRLYAAGGRQFTPHSNLQLGLLWQARTEQDFLRLQIFYTHNFDLR